MSKTDPAKLEVVTYPDVRLLKKSVRVERFDPWLRQVARRMFELMYRHRGVGLAASQAGLNIRLFVCNPTGKPADEKVYVNPVLTDMQGAQDCEEGCLSLPGVNGQILRAQRCRIDATDLDGNPFADHAADLLARIWQHEMDHLDGVLIFNRFGEASRLVNRRAVRELEAKRPPAKRQALGPPG